MCLGLRINGLSQNSDVLIIKDGPTTLLTRYAAELRRVVGLRDECG
jgi:hypothetical protein